MDSYLFERLAPHRLGITLTLLALLFGFGLGGVFGAAEDEIKGHLKDEATAVLQDKYEGDAAKAKAVTSKSWTYFKRAHLHAGGLGAAALAQLLLLTLLCRPNRWTRTAGILLGAGALLYPIFWMLAALRAPGLGGTGAAKESLQWLAIPSSGAVIVGTVLTIVLTVRGLAARPD